MNLYEEIEKIKATGYSEQNAQSKLGQDIVLKAIADSGMARNATIKGGDYDTERRGQKSEMSTYHLRFLSCLT